MSSFKHIVIIGGGITGLSAAFHLRQHAEANHQYVKCTIIEESNRFGGKIQTHRQNGVIMETGPDSMLARKPAGMELIRNLGIESEIIGTNARAHKTYFLRHGELVEMPKGTFMGVPMDVLPFLKSKMISPEGKIRALSDFVRGKTAQSSDESLGQLLRKRVGDEVVDALCEPLLAGIYAGKIDDLSVKATYPQFQTLTQKHRSLLKGLRIQRRMAPPTNNYGRSTFITLRGGLETLIERLVTRLGDWADLRLNTSVEAIEFQADGRYTLNLRNTDPAGIKSVPSSFVNADAVILTTPAHVAKRMLDGHIPTAGLLAQTPYVSTATILVGFARAHVHVDLDASGFVIPRAEKRAITASTWVSTKWPHTSPDDVVMIRCYVGRSGQTENLALDDEGLVQLVRRELADILQITAKPLFSRVTRWNSAMPQYHVQHLERLAQVEASLSQARPGLYIAGAGYRGLGIPDCISQGQSAMNTAISYVGMSV
jgi:protoporphyrinogen/coproporphyrinogen III oxidase